jgi:FkbH-like protein
LTLSRRGVALAVVSKNEESVALEAMRRHPEMLIRPEALAAWRINWRDKAENIVALANELNLGLQSIVFIDDHPVERARVRSALPEVLVPEWPADPSRYVLALSALSCFDTAQLTDEDLARTSLYRAERARKAVELESGSMEEWLATLGTEVTFAPLDTASSPRAAQLLNKTNQMNLRTRRLTEAELLAWAREPQHELWVVTVSDRFGSAGLTGILGLRCEPERVVVEDFVLSCRVMGRRVEETLVWAAVERARALGRTQVVAELLPTPKNRPCLELWERSGFTRGAEPTIFVGDATQPLPRPGAITVRGLAGSPSPERLHA